MTSPPSTSKDHAQTSLLVDIATTRHAQMPCTWPSRWRNPRR